MSKANSSVRKGYCYKGTVDTNEKISWALRAITLQLETGLIKFYAEKNGKQVLKGEVVLKNAKTSICKKTFASHRYVYEVILADDVKSTERSFFLSTEDADKFEELSGWLEACTLFGETGKGPSIPVEESISLTVPAPAVQSAARSSVIKAPALEPGAASVPAPAVQSAARSSITSLFNGKGQSASLTSYIDSDSSKNFVPPKTPALHSTSPTFNLGNIGNISIDVLKLQMPCLSLERRIQLWHLTNRDGIFDINSTAAELKTYADEPLANLGASMASCEHADWHELVDILRCSEEIKKRSLQSLDPVYSRGSYSNEMYYTAAVTIPSSFLQGNEDVAVEMIISTKDEPSTITEKLRINKSIQLKVDHKVLMDSIALSMFKSNPLVKVIDLMSENLHDTENIMIHNEDISADMKDVLGELDKKCIELTEKFEEERRVLREVALSAEEHVTELEAHIASVKNPQYFEDIISDLKRRNILLEEQLDQEIGTHVQLPKVTILPKEISHSVVIPVNKSNEAIIMQTDSFIALTATSPKTNQTISDMEEMIELLERELKKSEESSRFQITDLMETISGLKRQLKESDEAAMAMAQSAEDQVVDLEKKLETLEARGIVSSTQNFQIIELKETIQRLEFEVASANDIAQEIAIAADKDMEILNQKVGSLEESKSNLEKKIIELEGEHVVVAKTAVMSVTKVKTDDSDSSKMKDLQAHLGQYEKYSNQLEEELKFFKEKDEINAIKLKKLSSENAELQLKCSTYESVQKISEDSKVVNQETGTLKARMAKTSGEIEEVTKDMLLLRQALDPKSEQLFLELKRNEQSRRILEDELVQSHINADNLKWDLDDAKSRIVELENELNVVTKTFRKKNDAKNDEYTVYKMNSAIGSPIFTQQNPMIATQSFDSNKKPLQLQTQKSEPSPVASKTSSRISSINSQSFQIKHNVDSKTKQPASINTLFHPESITQPRRPQTRPVLLHPSNGIFFVGDNPLTSQSPTAQSISNKTSSTVSPKRWSNPWKRSHGRGSFSNIEEGNAMTPEELKTFMGHTASSIQNFRVGDTSIRPFNSYRVTKFK